MKKKMVSSFLIALVTVVSIAGCGKAKNDTNIENETEPAASLESEEESSKNAEAKIEESQVESSSEDSSEDNELISGDGREYGLDDGHYDRTYLAEENSSYIYKMTDEDLISKYDKLYADAFKDMINSYEEVMQWQNQSYQDQSVTTSNLLYVESSENNIISTGSYFEMDYNFDLNNVGYTYVDLDSDGSFELIFGILKYEEWTPDDIFERAYALVDGKVVKFCEGGSRDYHWLGNDGYIYETGSGGAAYSGTWRLHFDSTSLKVDENTDWGSNGFIEDEFLGYWEKPVHITDGPITDIDAAAQLPENAISDEDWNQLNEEWESRQVGISWLKLSDYLEKYPLVGA